MAGVGGCGAPDQGFVRDGVDHDGLLHESVEELAAVARPTPIEPKGELIKVELQVFVADRTLVVPRIQRFKREAIRWTRGISSDADSFLPFKNVTR